MRDAEGICEDGAGEYAPEKDEVSHPLNESQYKMSDALNQLSVSSADSLNNQLKTESSIQKSVRFQDNNAILKNNTYSTNMFSWQNNEASIQPLFVEK